MDDNPIRGVIATWWALWALITFFVLLRFYTKKRGPIGNYTWDDWVLVGSWAFMTGMVMIFVGFIVHYNLADPKGGLINLFGAEDVTDATAVLKGFYVATSLGFISVFLAKLSLLMLYWHLFQGIREMRWWLISFTFFLVATSLGILFWRMFSCQPMSMNWDAALIRDAIKNAPFHVTNRGVAVGIAGNQCLLRTLMYAMYALYAQSIITDIGLIALSIPLLKKAHLGRRDSVGVFLTFSLAGLTIAAATVRAVVLLRDGSLVGPSTWGYIEGCLCIIVTSMVVLRSFAVRIVNVVCDAFCCGMKERIRSRRKSCSGANGSGTGGTAGTLGTMSSFKDGEPRRWATCESNLELGEVKTKEPDEAGGHSQHDTDVERIGESSR